MREERKQLEWTRQELLRKGKDLLAQNRHRRNQGKLKMQYNKKQTLMRNHQRLFSLPARCVHRKQSMKNPFYKLFPIVLPKDLDLKISVQKKVTFGTNNWILLLLFSSP